MTDQYRTVVRAVAALTTQARRIADALETPVVEYVDGEQTTPTTPEPTCDTSIRGAFGGVLGPCALRSGHDGPVHRDRWGGTWAGIEEQPGPAEQCTAENHTDLPRRCIRPARHTEEDHADGSGRHWLDSHAVYPTKEH